MPDRSSSTQDSLDWDDLRIFLAVARAGSLRGAARALRINHATVDRRLRGLEGALGSALFERRPEGLVPTAAGEALQEPAEQVEAQLFAARRRLDGRDTALAGRLRLSLPHALMEAFLAEELARFAALHPGIELEVELTDSFSDLARREADVSLRMAHDLDAEHEDAVIGRRLLRYAKTAYAAPALLQRVALRDPAACAAEPAACWLGWSPHHGSASWPRETDFPDLPLRHRFGSHALQVAAARAGLGVSLLPCFLGDRTPGLRRVPGAAVRPDRSLWLLLHRDLRHTARVRAFLDFVAPAVLSHRALLEGEAPDSPQ